LETIKQEACGLVLSDMYLSLPVDHFSPPEEEPHFTPTHTQQKSKKKRKKKPIWLISPPSHSSPYWEPSEREHARWRDMGLGVKVTSILHHPF